jgi:hypothetical protein
MKIGPERNIIAAVLLFALAVTSSAHAQDRPNVVIMLADNVGYGDIGAYGAGKVRGMPTPRIDQIEADPREEMNTLFNSAWVIGPYLKVIGDYRKTLEKYPNPRAVNMTDFGR